MISDNILPSNEGRGYVLRRIIRRAYRHGRNLGYKGDFLADLCEIVISNFEKAYPELRVKEAQIKDVVLKEENKFQETLEQGIEILNGHIKELIKSNKKILSGKLAFQLYDTYGFPFELTLEILNENSLKADEKAFKEEMEAQRERARKARLDSDTDGWAFKSDDFTISKDVSFVGYNKMNCESKVISLIDSTGNEVDVLKNMQEGIVVIENTPFYGESGGQIGDTGIIKIDDNNFAKVLDSKKSSNQKIYQKVKLEKGSLNKDSKVICEVDSTRRMAIARNHSATHLLHKALKEVLGDHVNQAGSLVEEDRLRFDFSHYKALDKKEIDLIEQKVNMAIFNALDINTEVKSLDEAKKSGAMALFSEKYADDVRVVSMGNYSKELCGGTHVSNTSQIQMFKLLSEVGIASGVRRIEAITGYSVYNYLNEKIDKINKVSLILKTKEDRLIERSNQLIEDQKLLQKEIESIKAKIAAKASENMFNDFEEINGIKISANILENMDIQQMRKLSEKLKDKLENSVIVLINKTDSNLNFLATATDSAIKKNIHCGKIISKITALAGGKGGGRPNMAQGGAPDITKAEEALELSKSVIKEQINS
jgi:alanyl-tRNA synthetase